MSYPDISNIQQTFIDFEASSLNEENSYPISIGIVHHGKAYYWLIKPKLCWTDWDKKSEQLHGLSKEFLIANGSEPDEVIKKITSLLGTQCTLYSDNPFWEKLWLNKLGIHKLKVADAYELILPGNEEYVESLLKNTLKSYGLTHHHALDDAITLALTINQLL